MFSLICVCINDWVNNREAGDLRRYRGHYDVIVMRIWYQLLFDMTPNVTIPDVFTPYHKLHHHFVARSRKASPLDYDVRNQTLGPHPRSNVILIWTSKSSLWDRYFPALWLCEYMWYFSFPMTIARWYFPVMALRPLRPKPLVQQKDGHYKFRHQPWLNLLNVDN